MIGQKGYIIHSSTGNMLPSGSLRADLYWQRNPGPVFCLLLGVSSVYAQAITGQVTEVTYPVIGRAQPELTRNKKQKTGPFLYYFNQLPLVVPYGIIEFSQYWFSYGMLPDGIKPFQEQYWQIMGKVLWHSSEGNSTWNCKEIYQLNMFVHTHWTIGPYLQGTIELTSSVWC